MGIVSACDARERGNCAPHPDMEDIEVWRSAHHMMKRYGDDAVARASSRADALLAAGNKDRAAVWQRIAAAIGEMEREGASEK